MCINIIHVRIVSSYFYFKNNINENILGTLKIESLICTYYVLVKGWETSIYIPFSRKNAVYQLFGLTISLEFFLKDYPLKLLCKILI